VSERLPKLKENSKLIKLKKEINGIIEDILKEDQSDIKDKNKFMYNSILVYKHKYFYHILFHWYNTTGWLLSKLMYVAATTMRRVR
jgi:hypothetical protein